MRKYRKYSKIVENGIVRSIYTRRLINQRISPDKWNLFFLNEDESVLWKTLENTLQKNEAI